MSEHIQERAQTAQVSGLGLELKRGREAKGYTVERIADELHLRPSIVTAMEEENYELLPGDIFLKGYIRSYARLVGLSENDVVQLLDQHLSREADLEAQTKHIKGKQKRKKHSKYALILLLIAIVSGVVFYFWSEKLGNGKVDFFQIESELEEKPQEAVESNTSTDNGDEVAPLNSESNSKPSIVLEDGGSENDIGEQQKLEAEEVVTAITEAESDNLKAVTPVDNALPVSVDLPEQEIAITKEIEVEHNSTLTDTPIVSNPDIAEPVEDMVVGDESSAITAAEPETAESIQGTAPITPLEQGSIKVLFSGECWFTLKNGEGKTVIADLKKAGDEINYSGVLPFSVVVGAVSEVTVLFDDTLVDFSTVRVRNNRASLELTH